MSDSKYPAFDLDPQRIVGLFRERDVDGSRLAAWIREIERFAKDEKPPAFFPVPPMDRIAEKVRQLSREAGIQAYRDTDEPTEAERLLLAIFRPKRARYMPHHGPVKRAAIRQEIRDRAMLKAREYLEKRGLLPREGT